MSLRQVVSRTIRAAAQPGVRTQSSVPEQTISSLRLHLSSIAVTLSAACIFTVVEHEDHRHTLWCVFEIATQTILVALATAFFRTRIRLLHDSSVLIPSLVMVATLSLICEPFQRLFFDHGHSFEILVMHSQCNLMLALSVCGFRITFQRLAVLIAVFMTIFCCTIGNSRMLLPLVVLFGISCVAWLVASWWESVDRRLLHSERRAIPKFWLALAVCLPLLLFASAAGFGANSVTTALKGFMPSSGGTGRYDPFSRGGVNDGDALVAGNENIKSFAPIEDAPFVDSDKPSLYDVVNDTFDEPPRKVRDQQRSVALPAELLKHIHQKMAEAKQAGREFSLLRSEKSADRKRIHDLETHALFFVAGRTPAHFRMETYEHFSGTEWYPVETGSVTHEPQMVEVGGRHWLKTPVAGRGFEVYEGSVTHGIKVANLGGNVIPSPAHLVGVNIDKVSQPDMFVVGETGIVSMKRETLPSMTPVNLVSECVAFERLSTAAHLSLIQPAKGVTAVLPESAEIERIRELAHSWTTGIPRGWAQVTAITDRLRKDFVLDRSVKANPDSDSPMGDFLFEQRSGPEYMFASSMACLVRSLGYSSRLVSGFYARPEQYDARSRHTPVHAANAHFWCEVLIGSDTWITVDPSPGYVVPGPPPGFWERLKDNLVRLWHAVVRNSLSLAVLMALSIAVFRSRGWIQEKLLSIRWRLTRTQCRRRQALQLAVLVEHRLRLAGIQRAAGVTLRRWARQPKLNSVQPDLTRLCDIADWALFADTDGNMPSAAGLKFTADEISELESRLSFRKLTQLEKPSRQHVQSA